MTRKLLVTITPLLTIAALTVMPVATQAFSGELWSRASNSLCVDPTPGFEPVISGVPNYAPLTTANIPAGQPFPDTGASCAEGFPLKAVPLKDGGPGKAAWPYIGKLPPNAEWVSYNNEGWDFANVSPPNIGNSAPQYYIYDETFILCQATQELTRATITGTMFADNRAGAFLNGYPIGNQPLNNVLENFNGPPIGGFPFGTNLLADFNPAGVPNTLQFVVMDQSPPFTGLDFKAKLKWACKTKKK